jgi:AcrR family transcriptional regulator
LNAWSTERPYGEAIKKAVTERASTSGPVRSGRTPKAENTEARLIKAAFEVVSRVGYGKATIGRITKRAKVSHGTFYNYFTCRQEIFDLLPEMFGQTMFAYVRSHVPPDLAGLDREVARFAAYLNFISRNRWGGRLIYEAASFAPRGHERYIVQVRDGFLRALRRAMARGDVPPLPDDELVVIVEMLMSIREGIARLYFTEATRNTTVPPILLTTYRKAVARLLFGGSGDVEVPQRLTRGRPAPLTAGTGLRKMTVPSDRA